MGPNSHEHWEKDGQRPELQGMRERSPEFDVAIAGFAAVLSGTTKHFACSQTWQLEHLAANFPGMNACRLHAASTVTALELQHDSLQRHSSVAHPEGTQETNNIVEKWNQCCNTCDLENNEIS